MPPTHFLRMFGQADRDQIQNGNREISISQHLAMINGFAEKRVINNPESVLMQNLKGCSSTNEQIETAYLSVLARFPRETESSQWLDDVSRYGEESVKDLIWTLINSTEFVHSN